MITLDPLTATPAHPDHGSVCRVTLDGKFLRAGDRRFLLKGVTYGTFAPDARGDQYPDGATIANDFSMMARAGLNTVRVYTPPPDAVLDEAARHGLRLMIGLPWAQHVAFLDDRMLRHAIRQDLVAQVRRLGSHPAALLFALGNEIPPSVVRWHGRARVEQFLRELYDEAKAVAPDALFTYVNFPPTEYLDLSFLDVCAFNVYLHRQEDLRAYLARLQHLAGHKPLLLAEAGADSLREGAAHQAAITAMHLRTAFAEGACGAVAFAWTDEWWRGGQPVDDWKFGLVDEQRRPKPALAAVAQAFAEAPFSAAERAGWPKVSVVVCAYNAADTLGECLAALEALDYPDYEIIVVNDGSTDGTGAIAKTFPTARVIDIPNGGLSAARNVGMREATGGITAYTDADTRVDPWWLMYLVQPFVHSDVVGSGGPNVVPADDSRVAQCVARAPGGPTQVLVDDRIAEHVPGCNMAFRTEQLRAIGGFDPVYLRAGDDVDVCWRLQARGWRIGFSAAALVWHRHRATVAAYWRQQVGYGEGETWLRLKHPGKFAGSSMLWRGRIYSPLPFIRSLYRARINSGSWGTAPFPSVYAVDAPWTSVLPGAAEWQIASWAASLAGAVALTAGRTGGAFALVAGLAMIAMTAGWSLRFARGSEYAGATWRERALIAALHALQPLARLRGRIRGRFDAPASLEHAAAPDRVRWGATLARTGLLGVGARVELRYWTERWIGLTALMDRLVCSLRRQRTAPYVDVDDGWQQTWDLAKPVGRWGRLEVRTLVEEHTRGACLVRVSARVQPTGFGVITMLLVATALSAAMYFEQLDDWPTALALVAVAVLPLARGTWSLVRATAGLQAAVDAVAADSAFLPMPHRIRPFPVRHEIAPARLQGFAAAALSVLLLGVALTPGFDDVDVPVPVKAQVAHVKVQAPRVRTPAATARPVGTRGRRRAAAAPSPTSLKTPRRVVDPRRSTTS